MVDHNDGQRFYGNGFTVVNVVQIDVGTLPYKCNLLFHGTHKDVSLGVSPTWRGCSCKLTPLKMPSLRGTRISSDEQVR